MAKLMSSLLHQAKTMDGAPLKLRFNEKELSFAANCSIHPPDKEGLVSKKGPGKGQGYQPRWLRLKGNLLFYFKVTEAGSCDQEAGPKGVVVLVNCVAEKKPTADQPHAFTLKFAGESSRAYMFAAQTQEDADGWVEALKMTSYENLRVRLYRLQKQISQITGVDPLQGLGSLGSSSVNKVDPPQKAASLRRGRPGVGVFQRVTTHILQQGPQQQFLKFSSLDSPLFELLLSCRGLPLTAKGHAPSTLVRTSLRLLPDGAVKQLSNTEISEGSRDPVFYSAVMVEVTRSAASSGVVQFDVESVLSCTTSANKETRAEESDDEDVCLLAAPIGHAELPLQRLLQYPATSEYGLISTDVLSLRGAVVGVLSVQIRKASQSWLCDDVNKGTKVKASYEGQQDKSAQQRLQVPLKNVHVCPFQFPTQQGKVVQVVEEMGESVFNLQVPHQLLHCFIAADQQRLKDIQALGYLGKDWDKTIDQFKQHLKDNIADYRQSIKFMSAMLLDGECGYKRSTQKKDERLRFVPCNLHIQKMRVVGPAERRSPTPQGTSYYITTFGAPADHVAGFKSGGLKRLLQEARSRPSFISGSHAAGNMKEAMMKLVTIKQNIAIHKDVLFRSAARQSPSGMSEAMQSISQQVQQLLHLMQTPDTEDAIRRLRAARVAHLQDPTSKGSPVFPMSCQCKYTAPNDWIWNGKRFVQVSTEWDSCTSIMLINKYLIGLLDTVELAAQYIVDLQHEAHAHAQSTTNQIASFKPGYCWSRELIPAFLKLNQTLEGVFTVISSSLCFTLLSLDASVQGFVDLGRRRDIVFSQALTALMTAFFLSLSEHLTNPSFMSQLASLGYLAHFQSFLSALGEESGMLEDMCIAVRELRTVTFQFLEHTSNEDAVDMQVVGDRAALTVQLFFPTAMLALIPNDCITLGQLIPVVPVMFTQGIDEKQTMANLTSQYGHQGIQDEVNSESMQTLGDYVEKYAKLFGDTDRQDALQVREQFSELEKSYSKRKSKNTEFMMEVESLCRKLRGGRLTSCKSAKDRTGMAVTLEEACLLEQHHRLDPDCLMGVLNALRSQGTRLYNCFKNTGRYRYNFVGLAVKVFPRLYKPPLHVCSGIIND